MGSIFITIELKMPFPHLLLVLLVVVIWGVNFLFVKIGLTEISPLLLCTLRFVLAAFPAIFFVKPPKIPFKLIVGYGIFMFVLQFGFIFLGMDIGMTPGMASLIMQVQIVFSLLFSAIFLGERPTLYQLVGSCISFLGIALVGGHLDADISLLGFICILAAAASWGFGNLITKKINAVDLISVIVWGSFVAIFPMLLFALMFEGWANVIKSYHQLTWMGMGSLAYIVYVSTWIGYGAWTWLIGRYSVGLIVPFALLIPVVSMLGSSLLMGEPFQSWKLVAGLLVISGLGINLFGARLPTRAQPEMIT